MKWQSDQVSSAQLNDLRDAAERAWGDDTRPEQFVGHPDPCQGQCYVTSRWLANRLNGHVGEKDGHYFFVSPDHSHVIDLTGDQFSKPPLHRSVEGMQLDKDDEDWELDSHHKRWQPGPVLYKRTTHPLYKNHQIVPPYDDPRAQLFERRAEAALRGQRLADLMGSDPYPGDSDEAQERWKMNAPMLHDEPGHIPDFDEQLYQFLLANGQFHISPEHSTDELAKHAGLNVDENAPFATGIVRVMADNAEWYVTSNISGRYLHQVLSDVCGTRGWHFAGMLDAQGQEISEDFGPRTAMWYKQRKDGHLILSKTPLPQAKRLVIQGKTAYAPDGDEALREWARDSGLNLRTKLHTAAEWTPPSSLWTEERFGPMPQHRDGTLNWQLGNSGKGMIINGVPHTWNTENLGGSPHHLQYLRTLNEDRDLDKSNVLRENAYDSSDWITIGPEGHYTAEGYSALNPKDPTLFARFQPGMKYVPDVDRWAFKVSKTAEWPGGGDMTDQMKNREHLDMFNRGDPEFRPEETAPEFSMDEKELTCGECGEKLDGIASLTLHQQMHHRQDREPLEDGHFPPVQDFDNPLGFGTYPVPNSGETIARTIVMPLANKQEAHRFNRFATYEGFLKMTEDSNTRLYGAFRDGQMVGYLAMRLPKVRHTASSELPEGFTPWEPGKTGKGGMISGQPFVWATDQYEEPHHATLAEAHGLKFADTSNNIIIAPSGHYTHSAGVNADEEPDGGEDEFGRQDPRLTYVPNHEIWTKNWWRGHYGRTIEPEILMVDTAMQGQGIGSLLMNYAKAYHDSFHADIDSLAGECLARRMGMVNVSGQRWRYAKGKEPKDLIEAEIPFVYNIDGNKDHKQGMISIGYAGQSTHDVRPEHGQKFTPGGIVEGYYQPGGKVLIVNETDTPWSVYGFAKLWYALYPQMEITSVEMEDQEGKKQKLAAGDTNSLGTYLRTLTHADPAASRAYNALKQAGGKVYVVGGAIRSALQGKEPRDLDLMVQGVPSHDVEHALSQLPGRVDLTGKRFGVYRYRTHGKDVEIALPRSDKYDESGRGKGAITTDHTMSVEHDLLRRDFKANSMAVGLDDGQLYDPAGGVADIEAHRLTQTHPDSFREDPTRLVRALTMYAHHGLNPDEATRQDMALHAHRLRHESPDAMNKVITKMMESHSPANAIRLARETGVLKHLFPEVDENWDYDQNNPNHAYPLGQHLVSTLGNVSHLTDDPDVRLAALYHDVGKPASAWTDDKGVTHYYESRGFGDGGPGDPWGHGAENVQWQKAKELGRPLTQEETVLGANHEDVGARMLEDRMRSYNYPVARINRATHLVQHHMFPNFNTARGARRFINRVGDEHIDDLFNLREADLGGKGVFHPRRSEAVNTMRGLVDQARQAEEPTQRSQLAINGRDILNLGVPPSPMVGEVLDHLTNRVVDDPTLNDRDTLLQQAQQYMQQGGGANAPSANDGELLG